MNPDTTATPRTDELRYELENGVCKLKVDSLLCDPDKKVTGYFLTKGNGDICMVDKGAVRWITKEEWWWIFHESDHYPKKGQLSDRDHNEVARLREENAALKQGKVFVDPKWIYDLETKLAKAHEELCQAGLREYGN